MGTREKDSRVGATPMTPSKLRAIIARLGLSNQGLARALGHSSNRTVQRWLAGETPVPRAVEILLRLIDDDDILVRWFKQFRDGEEHSSERPEVRRVMVSRRK